MVIRIYNIGQIMCVHLFYFFKHVHDCNMYLCMYICVDLICVIRLANFTMRMIYFCKTYTSGYLNLLLYTLQCF